MHRYALLTVLVTIHLYAMLANSKPTSTSPNNHELLTKLGFSKVRAPYNHHRKRLAVESRHRSRSDDSHVFIIKLPPNPHYYAHNRPNDIPSHEPGKNIPVSFKNNGKPAKIYHWNIPVLKKIASVKQKSRLDDSAFFRFDGPDSWNEVLDKPEKELKPRKPSYYVPAKPKKASFTKYFPGNGKPHSFYVIEKSKKAHYHRLLP